MVRRSPVALVAVGARAGGTRPPSALALRRIRAALERDGAVAFDGLFPRALLEKIRRDVMRRHENGELRARGLVRDIGGRYTAVLPFAGPYLDPRLYANPVVSAVVEAALGPDHVIGSLEAIIALPGSSAQYQHIDGPVRFDRTVGGARRAYGGDLSALPPYALALATPLCDVDEENGPTALWPGSHRVALNARLPSERAVRRLFPEVRMTGPFGRSYLYDYRTFHRGTPNHSREPRPLLMLVFTRAWYRDPNHAEVQPSVLIRPRDLARVPERHRLLFSLAPAARRALWSHVKAR